MELRPCIDIHNGKVKQIVGGTLSDRGDSAAENFVSDRNAAYFAELFKKDKVTGGHVILLNGKASPYYEVTRQQALLALQTYPGGLMVGGGITDENAAGYIDAGASHVIVTSYVFREGMIDHERITLLKKVVGREHLVLDLSCRRRGSDYYIMTDRWQTFTQTPLSPALLERLTEDCDEFLIHGIDSEGRAAGIDEELIRLLDAVRGFPMTYAGGIASYDDIETIRRLTGGHMDITIGSALSLYGGALDYHDVLRVCREG
ncbi:MAG: phosphoribosylformimino-5-aminoimidazole carboxamide ribotide isomerase [Lachnospiraceae bacterium]|nr:phosphoribosylformimino-5-aminoimidazole carboxamide ribotide isomerase [Lachnospiraceae bacterium]